MYHCKVFEREGRTVTHRGDLWTFEKCNARIHMGRPQCCPESAVAIGFFFKMCLSDSGLLPHKTGKCRKVYASTPVSRFTHTHISFYPSAAFSFTHTMAATTLACCRRLPHI